MLFAVLCLNGLARLSFAGHRMRSLIVVASMVTEFAVPNTALAWSHEGFKPVAPIVTSGPCAAATAISGVNMIAKAKSLDLAELRDTELGKCTPIREAGQKAIALEGRLQPALQISSSPMTTAPTR